MADMIYDSCYVDTMKGLIDFDTDSFKVMYVTSTYTPTKTHAKRSDITNEVSDSGTGYTAGGYAIASPTVTLDGTNHRAVWDANDPANVTSASFTARGAVIYKNRGGLASADELVKYIDFGQDVTVTSGTFALTFNASGIFAIGD